MEEEYCKITQQNIRLRCLSDSKFQDASAPYLVCPFWSGSQQKPLWNWSAEAPGPAWALLSGYWALTAPWHFGFTSSTLFVISCGLQITAVKNKFKWKQHPGYRLRQKTFRKPKSFLFLVITCVTAIKCLLTTFFAGKTKWKREEERDFLHFW